MMKRLFTFLFPETRELSYDEYGRSLSDQISIAAPYAGSLALVAWVPYVWMDPILHPEVATELIFLRLGLSLTGLLLIATLFVKKLKGMTRAAYYLMATYLLQATPIITNLAGNDPEYLTGYQLALLVVSVFPARFTFGFMLIMASMVTFHLLALTMDSGFFSHRFYSWGNIAISFMVSIVIQYANERMRMKSELRKKKLDETRLALRRRTDQIENDMSIARLVQNNLLPSAFPISDHLEMHGFYQSMEMIGGDFYDVYTLDDHTELLFMADASGHGVSAALLAGMAKLSFHHAMEEGVVEPDQILHLMNREIRKFLRTEHFLTGFCLKIDSKARRVSFCNAGHRPVIRIAKDETVQELDSPGTIMGVLDEPGYVAGGCPVEPGDVFILYTDGVVESRNRKGEEFGSKRLEAAVLKYKNEPIARVPLLVYSDLRSFCGGVQPTDDITLLIARAK